MNVGYDILGNIALLKFDRKEKAAEKKKFALSYLKKNKHITTVLERAEGFKGRLRTLKTKWLAGDKTLEALYRENGCEFRFHAETCYFSPRLASERLDLAKQVRKGEKVLVMFGGVAPFAIVIGKHSKASKIVSVELGKECSKYALINVKRNKLQGRVEIVQGDVRKRVPLLKLSGNVRDKFDRVVMARPNLDDSFLDVAFPVVKKHGLLHYYGFYEESDVNEMTRLIESWAGAKKRKIKILRVVKAGDIGPYRYRYRADVKVLN